jgi:hypothetical protein
LKVQIDPGGMTYGEIMDWEEATGRELAQAFQGRVVWQLDEDGEPARTHTGAKIPITKEDGTALRVYSLKPIEQAAFAWITCRREDPTFTFAQAKAIKLGETEFEFNRPESPEGESDPTATAVEGGSPTLAESSGETTA